MNEFDFYVARMLDLWKSFDVSKIIKAVDLIVNTVDNFGTIYVCGNGGSAAIANHLVIDFQKR